MTTHFITTHPTTGQVGTRSSASKLYTHAVWGTFTEGTHGNPQVGTEPVCLSWSSRADLAEKAAAGHRKNGWADVVVTEAAIVATKTEQKRAVELAKFNLTTTDGETYSLADDAEELTGAELAEAREVADVQDAVTAEAIEAIENFELPTISEAQAAWRDSLIETESTPSIIREYINVEPIAEANVGQSVGITLTDGRSFSTKILAVIAHPGAKPLVLVKGWAYESGDFNPFAVVKYPLAQVADFAPFADNAFVAVG